MPDILTQENPALRRGPASRAVDWQAVLIGVVLVAAVFLAFGRTLGYGFLDWDDNGFVYKQPHVSAGFTWAGIAWALTNGPAGEWYPLAMFSHMLDCQLFGLNPAWHHLTSVLLHALNALALFWALRKMTGALWPSAMVAALFALHPLRVESVAWIAERRDVLSGLFFMLTLIAYTAYVRRPRSLGRYLLVVGLFALGLMSKAILVTLPALLLLLDYWPLGRFVAAQGDGTTRASEKQQTVRWIILEKLPLFALSLAVAVVTMRTHNPWHAPLNLPERLANAAVACVAYLGQFFVPVGLSFFYPHPESGRPAWEIAGAVALLLAISVAAILGRRSCPFIFVGWFWYLGVLTPVLGLTYVGAEARCDRYTYLAQIGVDIALVWGLLRLTAAWPARRSVLAVGSAVAIVALAVCTWRQTGFWRDDKTLWEHALACDPQNPVAHSALGAVLQDTDEAAATKQFLQALELRPGAQDIYPIQRAKARNGLGNIAANRGDTVAAIAHFEQALAIDPSYSPAHMNLAAELAKQGKLSEAVAHLEQSVAMSQYSALPLYTLALAQSHQRKTDAAIANYRKALAIDPQLAAAHSNLAVLLAERDEVDAAIDEFRQALRLEPDTAPLYHQIATLLRKQGKTQEAATYDERGRETSRRLAEAQNQRGSELLKAGKLKEAISQFRAAIATAPDYVQAHVSLADALASQGQPNAARAECRRALAIDPDCAPAKERLDRLENR